MALKYLLIFTLIGSIQGSFYFSFVAYAIALFILLAYLKTLDGEYIHKNNKESVKISTNQISNSKRSPLRDYK